MKNVMVVAILVTCGAAIAADPVTVEPNKPVPPAKELAKVAYESYMKSANSPGVFTRFEDLSYNAQSAWRDVVNDVAREVRKRDMSSDTDTKFAVGQIHWNHWGNETVQVEIIGGPDRGMFLVKYVQFVTNYDRPVDVRSPDAPRHKTVKKVYGKAKIVTAEQLLFGPCKDESIQAEPESKSNQRSDVKCPHAGPRFIAENSQGTFCTDCGAKIKD